MRGGDGTACALDEECQAGFACANLHCRKISLKGEPCGDGMPCMNTKRIMDGTLKEVLGTGRALEWSARDDVFAPTDAA